MINFVKLSYCSRWKHRPAGVLRGYICSWSLGLAVLLPSIALGQRPPGSADAPWLPDGPELTRHLAAVDHHEIELDSQHVYSLGDLIDLAESNNPTTRTAWYQAKASAASVGIAKSELYPTIIASVVGNATQSTALLYQLQAVQNFGIFETAVHLDYTLLDFGARRSEITSKQAQLVAANLKFNNEHLVLIEKVSEAYYGMLNAIGLRKAAEVSLNDAKALESAAVDRRANGLATVPEVLEAKAATAKANYDLKSALGAERVEFGHLATAITATPVKQFQVETLEDLHIPAHLDQSVEDAIAAAFQDRPDLKADEAMVRASEAEVKHAKTAYSPTFKFEGTEGWLRAWAQQEPYPGSYAHSGVYDASLGIRWTVFDGFLRESRISQAKAEESVAKNELHDRQDQITDQVWENYTNTETALEQREAAIALLAASSESYSAALESYKDGVRNFLDVLAAESELARARAINVTASTQVLQSFTDLAFRTGDLLTNHPKGNHP
jgi:outer membrane protein